MQKYVYREIDIHIEREGMVEDTAERKRMKEALF